METIITLKELSLLIGVWVAIYGIDSWRREHKGKRQIELAEETLALFYEARDVIASIRHPISISSETTDIERGERESDKDFEARKKASIVFSRYNKHQELFSKIYSIRYRFMAQIGEEESKPFEDLQSIVNEIFKSARMLARLWTRDHFRTEEQRDKHARDLEKYEAVFWDGLSEEDPITSRLEAVVDSMEASCQRVISGSGTLHSFLNTSLRKSKANK